MGILRDCACKHGSLLIEVNGNMEQKQSDFAKTKISKHPEQFHIRLVWCLVSGILEEFCLFVLKSTALIIKNIKQRKLDINWKIYV